MSYETAASMEHMLALGVGESQDVRLSEKTRHEAKYILPRFVQYQLGRELKSLKVLEEIQEDEEDSL